MVIISGVPIFRIFTVIVMVPYHCLSFYSQNVASSKKKHESKLRRQKRQNMLFYCITVD